MVRGEKMKDIWEYNKKAILITLILVLAILIVVYYLITTNRNKEIIYNNEETTEIAKIVLFGAREITITEGDKYIEPGYYALTTTNEIKQEEIEVTPKEIDTSVPGTYYISYTIGSKKETREIIVLEKEEKEEKNDKEETGVLTLTLEGESMMVINVGSGYMEPGYKAIDTIDGDITDKVEVSGVVNTGVAGSYSLTYEVTNSSLKKVTKTRTVIVKNAIIEASITGNPTSYTNQNVTLKIDVSGENFNYVKYPDGTVTKNKSSSYAIEKNGTYTFLIYDKESNYISKQVKVDKIDKTGPTGTCIGTVISGKTIFVATGKDDASGINRYVYYGDGKELNSVTQLSYTYPKELTSAYVNLYDNASNVSKVTCKMINSSSNNSISGACTATLKDGKTTFNVVSNSTTIKSYNFNSKYTSTTSTYTVSEYLRSNNYVTLTDASLKQTKINCTTTLETLPVILPKSDKTIQYKADTDTLKVNVVKDGGFYLSYIWAKDPVNQLKKSYTTNKEKSTEYILEDAVKSNNLKDKYVLGFNASPPVDNEYYAAWNKLSSYKLKEPLPIMIQNGKVLVNDPNKSSDLYVYYLDGSNQLKYIPRIKNLSVSERTKLYSEIIESGAQNTMTWRPILVENYNTVSLEDKYKTMDATRKQAICQLDSNNFVIITSENSSKGETTYPKWQTYIQKLGCRIAMEFDAGGSTSLLWKTKGSNDVKRITGAGRKLTSVVYFTELD